MNQSSKTFITTKHLTYIGLIVVSIIAGFSAFLEWPYNIVPIAAIIGIFIFIANFKYPMIGVYIYMLIFFFKPQDYTSLQVPYEKAIALMVILTLILNITFKEKKFELFPTDKALGAFIAVCFISIVFAGDFELAWDTFFKFFKVFMVYVFASRVADTQKRLNSIVWLYLLSLAFTTISTMVNYYTGGGAMNMGIERAGGIGDNGTDPNTLANTLVLGIPFFFYLYKHYKDNFYIKSFLAGVGLMSIWTIIITGSRGGMVGVLVVAFMLAVSSRYKVLATAAAVIVLSGFVAFMPDQYKERFATIFSIYDDDETGAGASAQGRVDGLVKGFVFMAQRPLFGVGIGNFKWANRQQYGDWLDAHNLLGKLVGELGLAGLLSFGFFLYVLISSLKYLKFIYHKFKWEYDMNWYLLEALSLALMIMLYQGLISHNLFRINWYVYACFIVIITSIVHRRVKKENRLEELDDTKPVLEKVE